MNIVEATYVARSGNSFDLGLGISDDFMIKGLSSSPTPCIATTGRSPFSSSMAGASATRPPAVRACSSP
ncbi:MAG: hypothetical protein ACLRWP_13695 [Bilophila wadsworthia]